MPWGGGGAERAVQVKGACIVPTACAPVRVFWAQVLCSGASANAVQRCRAQGEGVGAGYPFSLTEGSARQTVKKIIFVGMDISDSMLDSYLLIIVPHPRFIPYLTTDPYPYPPI